MKYKLTALICLFFVLTLGFIIYGLNFAPSMMEPPHITPSDLPPTPPPIIDEQTPVFVPPPQIDLSTLSPIEVAWSKKSSSAKLDIFSKPLIADPYFPEKLISDESKFYLVGKVTSGEYKNANVILATVPAELGQDAAYRFIVTQNKVVAVSANSNNFFEGDGFDHAKIMIDTTHKFADLVYPEKFAQNEQSFTLQNYNNTSEFFDRFKPGELRPIFVTPLGTVYIDDPSSTSSFKRNGFYLEAPDGTLRSYALDVAFLDKYNIPRVTWSDGIVNVSEYIMTDIGGCGARNYASVQNIPLLELTVAGKTTTGDTVYELKNINHPVLEKIYSTDYNPYDSPKLSYDKFVQSHPAFFWFDPFGRLIKFQKSQFLPQAECGKPVIYLYPEKTTNVSVTIDPKGGLTKSEPAYNTGWNVVATPGSTLTETKTGKTYPYLFWEGRGGLYETPKKGFVVSRDDVHNFLDTKLALLGLNKKEIADFEEFWEPRMQSSPYYFVAFLGTQKMNELAPLTVSPRPNTVIRVLMDYTPLEKPIEVEGYEIKTPARNGFTVLEWGGVLR